MAQVVALIEEDSRDVDFVGHARGVLAILMPATPAKGGQVRLDRLARLLATRSLMVADTIVRLTPIIGYAASEPGLSVDALEERAWLAMMQQAEQLDLYPTRWTSAMAGESTKGPRVVRALGRLRTPLQLLVAAARMPRRAVRRVRGARLHRRRHHHASSTSSSSSGSRLRPRAIWVEGFAALRRPELPDEPDDAPAGKRGDRRVPAERGRRRWSRPWRRSSSRTTRTSR